MATAKKATNKPVEEVTDGLTETTHDTAPETTSEDKEVKTAKAGKRSAKSIKETEEKLAKEERKAHASEQAEASAPKQVERTRTRLERAGKKLRAASDLVDKNKEYTLPEAIELATKTATTKFDSSVELHIRLNVDPRHADQNIRDNFVLPEGTGKTIKVAVFGEADTVADAKKAGADIAGNEDFLAQLDKGIIDFDILISTPNVMAKLGKYARVLGPKGLMPNPKSGTVTTNVAKAVADAKAGRVEYRVDSTGIVHIAAGKVSFGPDRLAKNVTTVFASVKAAKPASVKGVYVKNIYITTTMGPSIRIASSEL